ncbi:response regulator transcription factor [Eilatimonas milleporae]|uniref:DNA-binding response OmpR family regulator n=1 Tax=Eilatimonas milleporae TaxID=911205 RepID=A0A3M0C4S5_9PROT|nr:response regulator transcription factor [Eilatimonas milleporae]RMB01816.1 DNA-binding response OmpR family regulator [Eilatimonas milleporae]
MAVRTLLLVDDDTDLREALADQLALHEEFDTVQKENAASALDYLADSGGKADMLILDVGLPDMDGRELCKRVRKMGISVPVIMLTGMDSDADTVLGLDSGANDYVTKPFSFTVLLARIRAQFRQYEQSEDATFEIGPYHFRPSAKLLETRADGKKIRLTEKETSILKYLYRASGKPVGRDELLAEVWGYNSGVTTHTLETHVYRLRQKIEPEQGVTRLLITEPGGYSLQGLNG